MLVKTRLELYLKYLTLFLGITVCSCIYQNEYPIDAVEIKEQLFERIINDLSQEVSSNSKENWYSYVEKIENDTLEQEIIFKISYHFYNRRDSVLFRYWNNKSFQISQTLSDLEGLAESHWDLANFYYNNEVLDSSYFHYNQASELYSRAQNDFYEGRMLLNIATIQLDIKDYTESEISTSKALELIKPLKKQKQIYMAYNNLGIIFNGLGEYEKAIEYHKQALKYLEKSGEPVMISSALNNIGVLYNNKGNYEVAFDKFNSALAADSLYFKNPRLYAMLIDNLAYSIFKSGRAYDLDTLFLKSMHIRDSIEHTAGLVVNKLHYAEYLFSKKYTCEAYIFAKEAERLAKVSDNNGGVLSSLLLLSEIDSNAEKGYLREYITLNDSLQKKERAIRNKFARIRFETDEYIGKYEILTLQRKWIIGGASAFILILGLLYIIKVQKSKNDQLQLQKTQQIANEEIYNLLLESQKKLEQGKNEAKQRISAELHDGILSRFFGIRLSLEILNNKEDADSQIKRNILISEWKKVEKEIREVSHELNCNMFTSGVNFLLILRELWDEQKRIGKFNGELYIDTSLDWENIPNKIKIHLYRILQEALSNTIKYAQAKEISVSFCFRENFLTMKIFDNGKGFDTQKAVKGTGISNMYFRSREIGGVLRIHSGEKGTKIILETPLNKGA